MSICVAFENGFVSISTLRHDFNKLMYTPVGDRSSSTQQPAKALTRLRSGRCNTRWGSGAHTLRALRSCNDPNKAIALRCNTYVELLIVAGVVAAAAQVCTIECWVDCDRWSVAGRCYRFVLRLSVFSFVFHLYFCGAAVAIGSEAACCGM